VWRKKEKKNEGQKAWHYRERVKIGSDANQRPANRNNSDLTFFVMTCILRGSTGFICMALGRNGLKHGTSNSTSPSHFENYK
jgi:hypothetical protein